MKSVDIIKGISGVGFIQLTDLIPDPTTLENIAKLALQIVIAIITIWSLLKKKKK